MEKSFVTVEQSICPVCGNAKDTDSILFHRRLVKKFDHATVTGWQFCNACQQRKDEGFVALVAVDERQSRRTAEGTIALDGAFRLGPVVHLHREAWERIFDTPVPPDGIAFCDPEVIKKLQAMRLEASDEQEDAPVG